VTAAAERSPQEAALAYARAGWPVFPVTSDGEKAPVFGGAHRGEPASAEPCRGECGRPGHGLYDATTDPDQIRELWGRHPERSVAIATGAPGPDVLDVDVKPQGSGFRALNELKRAGLVDGYHAIVSTPGRGYHLYYQGTGQGNGRLRDHFLDFRSKGGYVVAPPSRDPRGAYQVVQHSPATGRTVSWRAIQAYLQPQPSPERAEPQRQRQADGDTGTLDRVAAWVERLQGGDRNFPLWLATKYVYHAGQLDDAGEQRLVEASLRSGLRGGEREARRTIASGRRAAEAEASPHPFAREPQRQLEAG
jgi:Bifunctional DNA primase/polymerase, N-terminal